MGGDPHRGPVWRAALFGLQRHRVPQIPSIAHHRQVENGLDHSLWLPSPGLEKSRTDPGRGMAAKAFGKPGLREVLAASASLQTRRQLSADLCGIHLDDDPTAVCGAAQRSEEGDVRLCHRGLRPNHPPFRGRTRRARSRVQARRQGFRHQSNRGRDRGRSRRRNSRFRPGGRDCCSAAGRPSHRRIGARREDGD